MYLSSSASVSVIAAAPLPVVLVVLIAAPAIKEFKKCKVVRSVRRMSS
jgi:hypothetical protein